AQSTGLCQAPAQGAGEALPPAPAGQRGRQGAERPIAGEHGQPGLAGTLEHAMAIFFTSDTHFGHGGALGLFRRPFASVAAMDEALVDGWNDTVGPADEVWHLGDFALGRSAAAMSALLDRLHGTKHLVAGNNDRMATRELSGWASVLPYAELDHGGTL